jgi:hypothetical protein
MGNTMLVQTGRQYTFEVRVSSALGSADAAKLTSNIFTFTASPFTPPPLVVPPTTGKLYLVGDGISGRLGQSGLRFRARSSPGKAAPTTK